MHVFEKGLYVQRETLVLCKTIPHCVSCLTFRFSSKVGETLPPQNCSALPFRPNISPDSKFKEYVVNFFKP